MDPAVIVSPHFDDAVLSCGQLLAGRPDMVVVTVFAGDPPPTSTDYDRNCGFTDSIEALHRRRLEDSVACAVLQATTRRLDWIDNQYEQPRLSSAALADELADVLDEVAADTMFVPLGLVHPDHEFVAAAARLLVGRVTELWVYEDLPSRVLWPETVPPALDLWRQTGDMTLDFAGTGPLAVKEAALGCYRSQTWALDGHACLVPERLWRVTPCE